MSDEVVQRLKDRHILPDDIKQVIYFAESTGGKLYKPDENRYLSKRRLGGITLYVEYSRGEHGYVVHTAYSHRSKLSGE